MAKNTKRTESTTDREIVTSRIIHASRERVWEALTDPKALEKWWGPNGFSLTTKEFSFTKNGNWVFTMHGPDGRDYPNVVKFTEIVDRKRISRDHGGDDGKVSFQATITLEDEGVHTKITMHALLPTAEAKEFVVREHHAIEGGEQTLGRLEDYLTKTW